MFEYLTKEIVMDLKKEFPAGTRVRLVEMNDPQAPPISTLGTVHHVDDIGTIFVNWDNGCGLGIAYGEDKCEKISEVQGGENANHKI